MSQRSYKEQKTHSTALIPHSFYRGVMPDYYPEITRHWHQEFELFLILEGECCFLCENRSFIAKEGDIILIQPNVMHAVSQYHGKRVMFDILAFHPRLLTGGIGDRMYVDLFSEIISCQKRIQAPITVKNPYYSELRASAETIFISSTRDSAYHDMIIKSELMRMFILLIDSGEIIENTLYQSTEDEILAPVIDFIQLHFEDEITIKQLAQIAHFSESYFMNYFRKNMGMSAMKYVEQVRIEHVCELLRNTNDNIMQIASQCGFNNITNFNRHFQKSVGMTPTAYRKASNDSTKRSKNTNITKTSIYDMKFKDAYSDLIRKAEHKNKTKFEVDTIICWLTGYTQSQLEYQLQRDIRYGQFFNEAPQINPNAHKIKGVIFGMSVETIEEPLMQQIRWLDKLIDELARGKSVNELLKF